MSYVVYKTIDGRTIKQKCDPYNLILNLGNKNITEIIDSRNLSYVKIVYLGENNIQSITGLINLNRLKCIYLNNNNISNIDNFELSVFPNLEHINLSENNITEIKSLSLFGLNKLNYLDVSDNPISSIGNLLDLQREFNLKDLKYGIKTKTPAIITSNSVSLKQKCKDKI